MCDEITEEAIPLPTVDVPVSTVEDRIATSFNEVQAEMLEATMKFGPFSSTHEGYAVILEELSELWEEIRKKRIDNTGYDAMRLEAKQVAAMAVRFMVDLC